MGAVIEEETVLRNSVDECWRIGGSKNGCESKERVGS